MEYTPAGSTMRLWLYRDEMPEDFTKKTVLFACLDSLSIWGGCDKNEESFMSWEFDKEIKLKTLQVMLKRLGCNLTEPKYS